MKKITVFALTALLAGLIGSTTYAQSASAGLFIEPSLTYDFGKTTIDWPSPLSNSTGTIEGLGAGFRVGMHVAEIMFLGIDGRYLMTKFKDSSTNYDAQSTGYNWGPVVGAQMPIVGLRVWGTYVAGGMLEPEASGAFDVKFNDPTGYRLGAGMKFLMLSLNLEYQNVTYGSMSAQQIGPFSASTTYESVKLKDEAWIASVSFPFAL